MSATGMTAYPTTLFGKHGEHADELAEDPVGGSDRRVRPG